MFGQCPWLQWAHMKPPFQPQTAFLFHLTKTFTPNNLLHKSMACIPTCRHLKMNVTEKPQREEIFVCNTFPRTLVYNAFKSAQVTYTGLTDMSMISLQLCGWKLRSPVSRCYYGASRGIEESGPLATYPLWPPEYGCVERHPVGIVRISIMVRKHKSSEF
jgi:hypothetical protein